MQARNSASKVTWDGTTSIPLIEQLKARSDPFRLSQQEAWDQYAQLEPRLREMVDAITELSYKVARFS